MCGIIKRWNILICCSPLLQKPFLVVLNKIDVEGAEEQVERFKKELHVDESLIHTISAKENQGLDSLLEALKKAAPAPKVAEKEEVVVVDYEVDPVFI